MEVLETARMKNKETIHIRECENGISVVTGAIRNGEYNSPTIIEGCDRFFTSVALCKKSVTKTLGYDLKWEKGYVSDKQFMLREAL